MSSLDSESLDIESLLIDGLVCVDEPAGGDSCWRCIVLPDGAPAPPVPPPDVPWASAKLEMPSSAAVETAVSIFVVFMRHPFW